jgi:hypothetical protein
MLPWKAWRFIGLNVVRALSLIALILVFVSNILVMVHDVNAVRTSNPGSSAHVTKGANVTLADNEPADCDYIEGSTVPNSPAGPFWAVLNRILILIQVILLIFSEIGWPNTFFARFLPFLGDEHGVGAIGVLECLIGAQVNSHMVANFPMVAAFLLFSIGCLNLILALTLGKAVKSHRSILSWRERDILPKTTADLARAASQNTHSSPAWSVGSPIFNEKAHDRQPSIDGYSSASPGRGFGFGRQGEKKAGYGYDSYLVKQPAHARSNSTRSKDSGDLPSYLKHLKI